MLCGTSEREHGSEQEICLSQWTLFLYVHAQKSRGENLKQVLIKDILISVLA